VFELAMCPHPVPSPLAALTPCFVEARIPRDWSRACSVDDMRRGIRPLLTQYDPTAQDLFHPWLDREHPAIS
jgi:hypothetical protein